MLKKLFPTGEFLMGRSYVGIIHCERRAVLTTWSKSLAP